MTGFAALLIGCGTSKNGDKPNSAPQCSDGIDNDGDGLVDFPDDPGCVSPTDDSEDSLPSPQCSDGRDNDGDGKIDYPDDPGCFAPDVDTETDDCPDGPNCPQCSNGKDDDGNGVIDYPEDPGCTSAADRSEFTADSSACGSIAVKQLPTNGMDSGTFDTSSTTSTTISPCGGGAGSFAVAYELHLDKPAVIVATTDTGGTTADTVIDIRTRACDNKSEIACNDDTLAGGTDADGNPDQASTVTASLLAGTYFIIVEGHDSSVIGNYQLQVTQYAGEGTACTDGSQCGPGLVCRIPLGGTDMVCAKPVCSDGVDDDGDGKADFPDDPGCTAPDDNDETDDCPNGPNCPQCSNGKDDDGDGMTDYPSDPACKSAAGDSESCQTHEGVTNVTASPFTGDTTNAVDDYQVSCAFDTGGQDLAYQLELPPMQSLHLELTTDSFLDFALLDATCGAPELACASAFDTTVIDETNLQGGFYYVIVDGDDSFESGTFSVAVSGVIASGGSCETTFGGALTCASGSLCKGNPGSKVCAPTACSDGIDNNGDGKIDFPFDPGCSSPDDDSETTVCPGPNCPVCSNGSDDDGDGLKDFPADFGCASAGGTSEKFCAAEVDPVSVISAHATNGTLVGKHHNLTLACHDTGDFDVTYALQIPVQLESLHLDTEASTGMTDSVLQLSDPQCSAAVACNDDTDFGDFLSTIDLPGVAPGNYAVTVQAFDDTQDDTFVLSVSGVAVPGAACTDPLFAAGVLACPTGQTCTAGKCQ